MDNGEFNKGPKKENITRVPNPLVSAQARFDQYLASNQPDLMLDALIEDLSSGRQLAVSIPETLYRYGETIRNEASAGLRGIPTDEQYDRTTRRGMEHMKVVGYDIMELSKEITTREEAVRALQKLRFKIGQDVGQSN